MKKVLLSLSFLISSASSLWAQNDYNVTFINKYKGENVKLEKVYLFSIEDGIAIDSAENVNNVFTIKGKSRQPQLVSICGTSTGYNVISAFILDETPVEITLDKGVEIKGSETNKKLSDIVSGINERGMKQNRLQHEAAELAQKYNNTLPDSIAQRLDKEWVELNDMQINAVKNAVYDNKDNLIPVYFLLNYPEVIGLENADKYLQTYKYKDNAILASLYKKIETAKRKATGKQFTDFTLNDIDGNQRKLSDFAGKGNYVLVDFWASWCGPCRAEMPNIVKAYSKYHPKGFEIVGVSLDNNESAWKKSVAQMGMTWPQLSDLKAWKSVAAEIYGVKAIPSTLLIDPEGKIVASDLRGEELLKKLEEIYNN